MPIEVNKEVRYQAVIPLKMMIMLLQEAGVLPLDEEVDKDIAAGKKFSFRVEEHVDCDARPSTLTVSWNMSETEQREF